MSGATGAISMLPILVKLPSSPPLLPKMLLIKHPGLFRLFHLVLVCVMPYHRALLSMQKVLTGFHEMITLMVSARQPILNWQIIITAYLLGPSIALVKRIHWIVLRFAGNFPCHVYRVFIYTPRSPFTYGYSLISYVVCLPLKAQHRQNSLHQGLHYNNGYPLH